VGVGMLVEESVGQGISAVEREIQLAGLKINRAMDTKYVYKTSLTAKLLKSAQDMRGSVIPDQSDNTQAVECVRIDFLDGRMILQNILQNAKVLAHHILVKSLSVFKILGIQKLCAVCAGTVFDFAEDAVMIFKELDDVFLGICFQIYEISAQIISELVIELILIVEEMSILFVIHLGDKKLIAVAVQIGILLLIGQLIKMEDRIIIISGTVLEMAADHISSNLESAPVTDFLSPVDCDHEIAPSGAAQYSEFIFQHIFSHV
jgi:hypothetical protein